MQQRKLYNNPVYKSRGSVVKTARNLRVRINSELRVIPHSTRGMVSKGGTCCVILYDYFYPDGRQAMATLEAKDIGNSHSSTPMIMDPQLKGFFIPALRNYIPPEGCSSEVQFDGQCVGRLFQSPDKGQNRIEMDEPEAQARCEQAIDEALNMLQQQPDKTYTRDELQQLLADYFAGGYHRGFMTFNDFVPYMAKRQAVTA